MLRHIIGQHTGIKKMTNTDPFVNPEAWERQAVTTSYIEHMGLVHYKYKSTIVFCRISKWYMKLSSSYIYP
jgi:hypothetical protein